MSRLEPLSEQQLSPAAREMLASAEAMMGFTPNDGRIMARDPQLMQAFAALVGAIYRPGKVPDELKRLVGLVASSAAGCQYCMAHTAFSARRKGAGDERLAQVWEFESSNHFSEAERAALRLALLAAQVPNGVSDGDYAAFARHYDEDQQLEILAVISLFGFLNRWNSTLATEVESGPRAVLDAARPPR